MTGDEGLEETANRLVEIFGMALKATPNMAQFTPNMLSIKVCAVSGHSWRFHPRS